MDSCGSLGSVLNTLVVLEWEPVSCPTLRIARAARICQKARAIGQIMPYTLDEQNAFQQWGRCLIAPS